MNDVAAFEAERPRLLGLAYRMLGSLDEAEDVVQDAWLRWSRTTEPVDRPAAWLTTVTTRLALDRLRSASVQRTEYVGEWLPEPVAVEPSPEATAELAESLTLGFLVLLDRLSGVERAVILLADVFQVPFAEIATTVGKSEAACRQIASRARRRLAVERAAQGAADRALLEQLLGALALGDADALLALLHPDVVTISDGGPHRHAARRPVVGAHRVSRLLLNLAKRDPNPTVALRILNLGPAAVIDSVAGRLVLQVDARDGRIVRVRAMLNPDKVRHVDESVRLV